LKAGLAGQAVSPAPFARFFAGQTRASKGGQKADDGKSVFLFDFQRIASRVIGYLIAQKLVNRSERLFTGSRDADATAALGRFIFIKYVALQFRHRAHARRLFVVDGFRCREIAFRKHLRYMREVPSNLLAALSIGSVVCVDFNSAAVFIKSKAMSCLLVAESHFVIAATINTVKSVLLVERAGFMILAMNRIRLHGWK
jgi:hypothetical protein